MSYGKIFDSLMSSSLMDEGPVVTAVWTLILATKDKNGITSISPRILAKAWRMDTEKGRTEVQKAWDVLTKPDPQSSNIAHEGRRLIPMEDGRWLVVSHSKYQALGKEEEEKITDAIRKADERAKEKADKGLCSVRWCKKNRVTGSDMCATHTADPEVHEVVVDEEKEPEETS